MAKLGFAFAPGPTCGFETLGLAFRPLPDQGFVSIQVSRRVAFAMERLAGAVGALPGSVGEIAGSDPALARIGPLAFMALPDRADAPALVARVNGQSNGATAFRAVDVSHRGATFRLEGSASTEAVARTIEIDPASIAPGRCARTIWNRNSILIIRDATAAWRLTVDIGLGWALTDWMQMLAEGTLD
jgi:heterotetrameric sarcosine oxidase gamma subunit